ncbi:MAG TPA: cupredoxin family protein [Burkholderiales bacterium]|nr:cupredoxin family protein [Burkholderiales bacterium]
MAFIAAAHAAEPSKSAPRTKKARAPRDTPFGREGDPKKATRTVRIELSDTMRYFPDHVTVRKGQTVRFNLKNSGELPHEMVIGTMDDLKKHAATMRKHAATDPEDANMAHVEPGRSGRIVWQFTRAGEFYYGCLVPGHFEAGMIGTIVVR